ncbi:MAG TPA: glycosyltransferase family 4 protein [Bacteroidota bacterium]|nr:glycosyltransferase family 4 protein [Bacteroidota bacterium]
MHRETNARHTLNSRPRILFVSTRRTPFIEEDLRALAAEFPVTVRVGSGPGQIIRVISGVFRSDIVFCWFASVYAAVAILTARLLGRKSVVVIGGVDVAAEPGYGYGLWLSPWRAALVRKAIQSASKVLVVDESLKKETIARAHPDGSTIEILPTGYDSDRWIPSGRKEPLVLTVASVDSEGRLFVKGIDVLFEAARNLPRVHFVLVGFDREKFPSHIPPGNLSVVGIVEQSELLFHYRRAKVYCQPSRREGLPNTLCEAMLCGCIPVATDTGGTKRAVGPCGVVVPPNDPVALVSGIRRALKMNNETGAKARKRIVSRFPKMERDRRLIELIRELAA